MRYLTRTTLPGVALLILAAGTFFIGEQAAGNACIDHGIERLVPRELIGQEPEGFAAGIPVEDICRISHGQEVYTEVSLDQWDLAEISVVMLAAGSALVGAGIAQVRVTRSEHATTPS